MSQGWIKRRRQLLEHPRLAHPDWFHLWATLRRLASHSGAAPRMIFQGQEITLLPGQLITSHDRLAELTGMNPSKIERRLSLMKTEQQIEPVGGVRSRWITVTNRAGWQTGEQVTEQLANSCRTATEHTQEGKNDQKGGELKCLNALTLSFIKSWKDAENDLAARLGRGRGWGSGADSGGTGSRKTRTSPNGCGASWRRSRRKGAKGAPRIIPLGMRPAFGRQGGMINGSGHSMVWFCV